MRATHSWLSLQRYGAPKLFCMLLSFDTCSSFLIAFFHFDSSLFRLSTKMCSISCIGLLCNVLCRKLSMKQDIRIVSSSVSKPLMVRGTQPILGHICNVGALKMDFWPNAEWSRKPRLLIDLCPIPNSVLSFLFLFNCDFLFWERRNSSSLRPELITTLNATVVLPGNLNNSIICSILPQSLLYMRADEKMRHAFSQRFFQIFIHFGVSRAFILWQTSLLEISTIAIYSIRCTALARSQSNYALPMLPCTHHVGGSFKIY